MNKLLSLTFLAIALPLFANEQEAQLDERLNPVIEVGEDVRIDYTSYPSVHLDKNVVRLNNGALLRTNIARHCRATRSSPSSTSATATCRPISADLFSAAVCRRTGRPDAASSYLSALPAQTSQETIASL